jgi:hypothetical protein
MIDEPDEQLAIYEAMFFDSPNALVEFVSMPVEQRCAVLQHALELFDETGADGIGPFDRAAIGAMLAAGGHVRFPDFS